MLAPAWRGKKPVLRIVWAPASFTSVAVACPAADRATVAAALTDEHPALSHPRHVWGCEPVQDGRTLLHYEMEPGLFAVVRRLEDVGFGVESVWPMATWLAALAPEAAGIGRVAVVATDGARWHLYRQSASGRESLAGSGPTSLTDALHAAPTDASPSLLLQITSDEEGVLPLDSVGVTGKIAVWEALERPVVLPAKHPAQLLPPLPKLTLMRLVIAANLVCVLVALLAGCRLWQVRHAAETERKARQQKAAVIRDEIVALRARAGEIAHLEEMVGRALPAAELLEAAAARLPAGMVLTGCRIEGGGYRLEGWIDPGRREDWGKWSAAWTAADAGWMPPAATRPDGDGRWTMEGKIR